MGQSSSAPTNKTSKSVLKTKIDHATKTGILALPEHKLKEVPKSVYELKKLRTLDLSSNALTEIDLSLPNLKTLKVAKNKLTVLKAPIQLDKLTTLDASENQISDYDFSAPRLEHLSLKMNPIGAFPSTLQTSLKTVDLSGCGIRKLTLTQVLAALEDLILDANAIVELPPDIITYLPKLRFLSLEFNRIHSAAAIPGPLLESPSFFRLNLKGNPLTKADFLAHDKVDAFLQRRENVRKKGESGHLADLSVCGLDD